MLLILVALPFAVALLALLWRDEARRPWLLPPLGVLHTALALAVGFIAPPPSPPGGWLAVGALEAVVLLALAVLFLVVSCSVPGYLAAHRERPNRWFVAALALVLGFSTLAAVTQQLALQWAAIEGAALAAVPLIAFPRTPRAMEATWKYLIVGGTGLALALLGIFALAYAATLAPAAAGPSALTWGELAQRAPQLPQPWLRVAFALLFVGYATKIGLAPMHAWKPDAYGEAPGLASALLAGGLGSVGFLALAQLLAVLDAAQLGAFARPVLIAFGLLSLVWAAVFALRQTDIKRLIAYASIEQMGLLAIGLALAPAALPALLLHVLGNAWSKGALFLAAGNLHRAYASKHVPAVSGALQRLPWSAGCLVLGFLAASGTPPFATFFSEFGLLRAMFAAEWWWPAAIALTCLCLVFLGFSLVVIAAVGGESDAPEPMPEQRDRWATAAAPALALLLVLALGAYQPPALVARFDAAQRAWPAAPAQPLIVEAR